jgi:hypothetical protein
MCNLRSCIDDEERILIRHRLLQALTLHYPHTWIATDTYVIARLARLDFPRYWPDLVNQILAHLRSAFELEDGGQEQWRTENSLMALGAVVKELSSVRLGQTVTAFRHVIRWVLS